MDDFDKLTAGLVSEPGLLKAAADLEDAVAHGDECVGAGFCGACSLMQGLAVLYEVAEWMLETDTSPMEILTSVGGVEEGSELIASIGQVQQMLGALCSSFGFAVLNMVSDDDDDHECTHGEE